METENHQVFYRSRMLALGLTQLELQRMLERGNLTPVRRGAYLEGPVPDPATMHRLQMRAAMIDLSAGAVASHASAAVIHGLPTWGLPLDRLTVTRARRSGGRLDRLLHTYTADLLPEEIVTSHGIPVTSVARTIVDVARTLSFESAVVAADAALARKLVTPDQLAIALARSRRWPGVPAARRVVAFADGRSESVGESRSRVAITRAGLPAPTPQWEVRDKNGAFVARVDFAWPDRQVAGEFDGRVKYGRLLRPGQSPGDAVYEEKLREDALRAQGWLIIRWTWQDLATPALAAKLTRALTQR